jgi:hypothetical protein
MPGLVPGIHDFLFSTWMAGTSPAMTEQKDNGNERPEYPDTSQGVRPSDSRFVDA